MIFYVHHLHKMSTFIHNYCKCHCHNVVGGILEVGAAESEEPRVREISCVGSVGGAWGWLGGCCVGDLGLEFSTVLQSCPGWVESRYSPLYKKLSPGARKEPEWPGL